ncbi:hypothetical protein A3D88_02600 [Candidatus Peribacteria bacterium RIFCSPHIGHO2_02_FULL_52_16]|nr:MAG: hypothetical protein A2706_00425 [Candidatus Peribacteria bacterium RIFCSPHIGHO2_01_FULL_51_35]OGJ61652.1 MAG: hypothetical protein A3D88_02600 [Candidatus Peribacteria bacterium RIFCSPHIGHO2_02_FULL_52_16]
MVSASNHDLPLRGNYSSLSSPTSQVQPSSTLSGQSGTQILPPHSGQISISLPQVPQTLFIKREERIGLFSFRWIHFASEERVFDARLTQDEEIRCLLAFSSQVEDLLWYYQY